MKKRIVYPILAIILLTGFILRFHDYTVWPREGATYDEFAWTFLGISLWQKGVPTSWSTHAAYKNNVHYVNPHGAVFNLVTPYLEHPPLFGLVAGGFTMVNGVTSFDGVTIPKIRPLALFLGTLAIFSVFLLASAVYGDGIGLISTAIYAIIPTVAIGSRLVQNENFFIPFFLLALYFAYRYVKHSEKSDLYVSAGISALLPLAKVPWITAPVAVMAMFAYAKKWKAAVIVGIVTLICFSGFLVYGLLLDKEVFLNLWKLQLARYDIAFDSLFVLFREPILADRYLVDGWVYFGWAAMMLLIVRDLKKSLPVVLGFMAYAAVFVFAIPNEPLHGWYRYPFYPFLAIAIAVFLYENFNRNYLSSAVFYIVTGLSMFAESWGKILGFSFPVFRTYLAVVAAGALPGIFPGLKRVTIIRWVNIGILVLITLLSVWTIFTYNEQ